jgi:hypothetical protein
METLNRFMVVILIIFALFFTVKMYLIFGVHKPTQKTINYNYRHIPVGNKGFGFTNG